MKPTILDQTPNFGGQEPRGPGVHDGARSKTWGGARKFRDKIQKPGSPPNPAPTSVPLKRRARRRSLNPRTLKPQAPKPCSHQRAAEEEGAPPITQEGEEQEAAEEQGKDQGHGHHGASPRRLPARHGLNLVGGEGGVGGRKWDAATGGVGGREGGTQMGCSHEGVGGRGGGQMGCSQEGVGGWGGGAKGMQPWEGGRAGGGQMGCSHGRVEGRGGVRK